MCAAIRLDFATLLARMVWAWVEIAIPAISCEERRRPPQVCSWAWLEHSCSACKCACLRFWAAMLKSAGEKLHKVHVLLVHMLQQHVCHKCGCSTKQIGHWNRPVQKPGSCKRKDLDHYRHCQKAFAKGGSGLRKHTCRAIGLLLPFNMDLTADRQRSVRFALQELQKLSRYQIEQLGLADLNPVNVAVAAIKYLHFTPLLAQSHNITLCQYHIAKFDIVQPTKW